ncbi:hypothetical protein ACS0TY_002648 [Phlomoides rotata]
MIPRRHRAHEDISVSDREKGGVFTATNDVRFYGPIASFQQGCLGALDCTYIDVHIPTTEKGRYRNQKGIVTVNVLGVCDMNMKFVYVLTGWEGFSEQAPLSAYLPPEIWRMPQLRHLVCYDSFMLPNHNPADGPTPLPLENLQTLLFLHNLEDLHQLEKLSIIAKGLFSWEGRINPVFPSSLKKLTLDGGRLPWKDMSIVGRLPNLQVLKLKNGACDGDTWETADGEFQQLQYLHIRGSNLKDWNTESDHFPKLKRLVLHRCWNLTGIPDISTLEKVSVDAQNQSLMKSTEEMLEEQRDYDNVVFQLYYINSKSPLTFSLLHLLRLLNNYSILLLSFLLRS